MGLSQPYLLGPDTSHNNGHPPSGRQLAADGYGFALYKVGQGSYFADPMAAATRDQIRAGGLVEGRYHFLVSDTHGSHPSSGAAQIDYFIHLTESLGDVEGVGHCIDVEKQDSQYGPSARVVADAAARWRQKMPGLPLGGYSGRWYWHDLIGDPSFPLDWQWSSDYITGSGDARWLVQHGGSDKQGVSPGYWHPWGRRAHYDLRQFTSSASLGGLSRVDCSVFPGTRAQLTKLWLPSGARPPAPRPKPPAPHPAPHPHWTPPKLVVALQADVHVTKDGHWGAHTDASLEAVRRNPHSRAEQAAVGTTVDGRWGPRSQSAYVATVRKIQTHLRVKVDGDWGPKTDHAFLVARHSYYGK